MTNPTPKPDLLILYVADAARSAAFYAELLGRPPAETSPTFALFPPGPAQPFGLGLWSRGAVVPPTAAPAGGVELVLHLPSATTVDDLCADWRARGRAIAEAPVTRPFGRSFVALDPDGHRLRVLARPAA